MRKDKGRDKKEKENKGKRIAAAPLQRSRWEKKKKKKRQPEAKRRVKIGLKFIRKAQKDGFSISGSLFEKRQRVAHQFAEAIGRGFCRRRHLDL